jgi:hypothetical protein
MQLKRSISLYLIASLNFVLFLLPESIYSIPLAFFSPVFIWIIISDNRRFFHKIRLSKNTLSFALFYFGIYAISISYNYIDMNLNNLAYYIWPVLGMVMVLPLLSVLAIIRGKYTLSNIGSLAVLASFILLACLALLSSGRFRFGFGSNMLYRIVIFNFFIYLFCAPRYSHKIVGLFAALYIVYATGSRGGVITLFGAFLLYLISLSWRWKAAVSLILIMSTGTFLFYFDVTHLFSDIRVLNFSLANNNRSRFYFDFWDWLSSADVVSLLLGSGYRSWPFRDLYPHNFVLELFHSYGAIYALIYLVILCRMLIGFDWKLGLIALPFIVGAILSGSLYDNVVFIGFTVFYVVLHKRFVADPFTSLV